MSILCSRCGSACGEAEYKIHIAKNCQTIKCPQCPQFYDNAEALLRHTRAIHDKEFQCTICQIEYATKYTLERHLAITHKQIDKEKIKCEKCGEMFEGEYFLKKHILHVHKKEFVCTLCRQEFVTVHTLKRHFQIRHKNNQQGGSKKPKELRIDCPKCGKSIAKSSLEKHFRIKHKHNEKFICHVCDRVCPSEKALQKHIDCRHAEENSVEELLKKKFKCPQCPRRFTTKWTLETHIKGKHQQKYKCELCDKILSAPLPLVKHKLSAHGIKIENGTVESNNEISEKDFEKKKFKCPQCPRGFAAIWTLRNHIKGKHEQEFKCELCNKLFSAPFPLIRHKMNVHGLEVENETVESNSEELLKKKYKCPQCPQRFTASWTLKNHIKGKHEEQFTCELCEKSFSSPMSLIRHKRNVHSLEIENEAALKHKTKTHEEHFKEESDEEDEIPTTSKKIKKEIENQDLTND